MDIKEMYKGFHKYSNESLEGKILVASPHLDDPYFSRSLIYVCAHDASGVIGIMINQKMGIISCSDFMFGINNEEKGSLEDKKFPLLFGGPVNTDMLIALSISKKSKDKNKIIVHTDIGRFVKTFLSDKEKFMNTKFVLAKGVSAWEIEQIEDEVKENAWFIIPSSQQIIFSQHKNKWGLVIKQLGITNFCNLVQYSGTS